MDAQEYTYYAFISYQRKDEKWAKWLQSKLENYKLPVANANDTSDKNPKYIRPVFRDKTDLTSGPLPKALEEALNQSRYLIVICSPNAIESPWVNQEIETFTKAGRFEFIIPFIIDGEPYDRDKSKGCFPDALLDIPKEKEPLGVSINEGGKERAFIRTVAYMLKVKFDELWNRHERSKRKIRRTAISCCICLMLIALCFYDYKRTKIEYFADWVDCNGVAEGIIPLTTEQVGHRCASFKFEFSRIPLGEKGFYSWRLNKVSLVNSKGLITFVTPDNHAFFYPIQEYKYTDGYVTEIINRDIYNRVVMRYTIKDDNNHKIACIVDMEGKEKHQGSAYLASSTTAFLSDVNSNNTMSKIKRFHYTRNEKGYIIKVTYHANDADELDETAIGDNNNIYGRVFELDSLGRVKKVSYINHEGEPTTDKYGVGCITYSYSQFEDNDTIEYWGNDGRLVYNEHLFARQINKLDKYGNPIEQRYEGTNGEPCYDYKNIYRQVAIFDAKGLCTEIKYYGLDGKLSYSSDNFAIQRIKYDSKGRYIEVSHFDIANKPCYDNANVSIYKVKYNSNDCIIEQKSYDINGLPCVEKNSCQHMVRGVFDDKNYLTSSTYYDINEQLALSSSYGTTKIIYEYDDYHQLVSIKYFDKTGHPCISKQEHCWNIQYSYDTRGNLTAIECFDIDTIRCICSAGYSKIIYKYDEYGNQIEERYFGVDDEPLYLNMCVAKQNEYTNNGLVSETRFYDSNNKLCLNNNWYAIEKLEYDNNGNCIKSAYYDADNLPCYKKDWIYSSIEQDYYNNDIVEQRFFDKEGNLNVNGNNYAIAKYIYNNRHQIVSYRFFDQNGNACLTNDRIHCDSLNYNEQGLLQQQQYFDNHNNPCFNGNGISKEICEYDDKKNVIKTSWYNTKNELLNDKNEPCVFMRFYDIYGRIEKEEYFGNNGKPAWKNNTDGTKKCCIEYEYDQLGNVVKTIYKDPEGNLTNYSGWAICSKVFDELSREIDVRYFDDNKMPIGGYFRYPIEKYEYGDNYNKLSLFYNDTSLVTNIIYNYEKGQIKKVAFTNNQNKPEIRYLLLITEIPCASFEYDYDEKRNITKISYYDERDSLFNTEAGIAYETILYDENGRTIEMNCHNKTGQLENNMVGGFATIIRNYDKYGNMTEQSYYDKYGRLANTPWTWSRRLQTFNDKGQYLTDTYYMPDGSITTHKNEAISSSEVIETNVRENLPEEDRILVQLTVESYGQMFELGFKGVYIILEFNEWNAMQSLDDFIKILQESKGRKKHLVLLPVGNKLGDEDVVEYTFSEDALSARIMDNLSPEGENRKIALKKYEEWKNR